MLDFTLNIAILRIREEKNNMNKDKIDEIFKNIVSEFVRENLMPEVHITLLEKELNQELNKQETIITQRKRIKI